MLLSSQQLYCTGILPVAKPKGKTSFSLVSLLRKLTRVKTIGHAGTLDPFAEGVMILLIGKEFTKLSNQFLNQDKEYFAQFRLGIETDTYDRDGTVVSQSPVVPSREEIEAALLHFQGTILQTPPMFSAKKVNGQKLYELARKGVSIERAPSLVTLHIEIQRYEYPYLECKVQCSKGTYIRSLAHDLGTFLSCGAHVSSLTRIRSGNFSLSDCCDGEQLTNPNYDWIRYLKTL